MAPIRHIQIGFKPQPDLIVVSINRITHTHTGLSVWNRANRKKEKKVKNLRAHRRPHQMDTKYALFPLESPCDRVVLPF